MNLQKKYFESRAKDCNEIKEGKSFKHHSYDIFSKLETDHILQEEIKQKIEYSYFPERDLDLSTNILSTSISNRKEKGD